MSSLHRRGEISEREKETSRIADETLPSPSVFPITRSSQVKAHLLAAALVVAVPNVVLRELAVGAALLRRGLEVVRGTAGHLF